jgi:hypothetical protein
VHTCGVVVREAFVQRKRVSLYFSDTTRRVIDFDVLCLVMVCWMSVCGRCADLGLHSGSIEQDP